MKRLAIILPLLILLTFAVSAQESVVLEDLRLFTRSAILKGEQEARKLGTESIVLGKVLYDGNETPLGSLLGDLLTAGTANSSDLSIVMNPAPLRQDGADWISLEGVIHKVDYVVYMQLRVLDGLERTPLAVIEKTMDYSPLADLLTVDYYDDYYYDEPVVREDYFMEPNDDPYSSVEYTPGDSYELALTQGDSDWFYFTVGEEMFTEEAVMVEIFTTGDTDTYMTVYGPDDPELYYDESDDYRDNNAGMVLTLEEPGTYWVVVSGYSGDISGYYNLDSRIEAVGFADSYEPNNNWDQATAVDWTGEQEHAFGPGDVMDVFTFTLTESRNVVLYTESQLDTYMDLYDEAGNYITSDDDGGKDSNARLEVYLNPGTYYAEVSPYDNETMGSYRMIAVQE
ncbi:MAG: PPC domain-containing protein [Spirochaetales bacterium]|nr:PPC domain-containing protein [Spirochaetales bacterium]